MTNYNDGNWHGWNGGECPVHPESEGDFVFEDGTICTGKPAGEWDWNDKYLPIIAFRVVKEPREFWMDDDGDFWNEYEFAKKYCDGDPVKFREVIK